MVRLTGPIGNPEMAANQ